LLTSTFSYYRNLVANNFVFSGSNNSVLASGLNCLQRDIHCNHRTPIYSSFAINCGGNKSVTSSDGTLYEIDGRTLSIASYYVIETNKWAVSTVGSFQDPSNPDYTLYSSSQFQKTQEPELYQTARISPSSLRYYGLGLQNGNYTVMLHFAETQILDPPTWKSTGRRIFDIYIQGNRVLKDFDIRAEENSFTAVTKKFIVPVTDNFLEIHFFWAGKGTCCVPAQGYYGPSVSAISVDPYDFTPTVSNEPPSSASKSSNKSTIAGISSGIGALVLLIVFGILIYWQRLRLRKDDEDELLEMSSRPDTFSYAELRSATEDFDPSNKLGEGGFGPVFKVSIFFNF
ncbi:hypothetical protein BHM03_00044295, partial [Ensete ventricosum]